MATRANYSRQTLLEDLRENSIEIFLANGGSIRTSLSRFKMSKEDSVAEEDYHNKPENSDHIVTMNLFPGEKWIKINMSEISYCQIMDT